MSSQKLNRAELRTWLRLVGGMRSLLNALDRQLRDEAGMTHDDYGILSELHRSIGRTMRMSDLAREVGFSPSRLSHAVSRMEDEGWITRRHSSEDGRVIEARLTDVGAKHAEQVSAAHLAKVRQLVFDTLGAEGARELSVAMSRVGRAADLDS
jgi:DNA-binding MarR family transcriptional regulator